MNTAKIISALDDELARLRQVRDLLAGQSSDEPQSRRRGRAPQAQSKAAPRNGNGATAKPARKKRVLSEEARQRIADAQKRRWAAAKRNAE